MRLVTFVVSTFGSRDPEAQRLLSDVARSSRSSVPSSLYEETSRAASELASFVRQAVTLSVRRELVRALRASFSPEEAQRCVVPTPHASPGRGADFDAPLGATPPGGGGRHGP